MAPSKKKKKAVANPARGFATVSQPSKSKEAANVPDDSNLKDNEAVIDVVTRASGLISDAQASLDRKGSNLKDMSPEELELHLEDAELQNVVASSSVRCKQEAARQVSRLETERRQLRSEAHKLSVADWLSDEVLDAVLCRRSAEDLAPHSGQFQDYADDTALLLKLWTLEIVLTALHFPNVDAAIAHLVEITIRKRKLASSVDCIWGLQEALEWYAGSIHHRDLPDYDHGTVPNGATDEDTAHKSDLETVAESVQVQSGSTKEPAAEHLVSDNEEVPNDIESLSSLSPSDSEDDDPSSLVAKYIRLQTLMFYTEQYMTNNAKLSGLDKRRSRLRKRIETIQRDVLFDRGLADAIWEQNLQDLRIEVSKATRQKRTASKQDKKIAEIEVSDDTETNLIGDMFNLNDEEPESLADVTSQTHIQILDFGKWSGIPPRRILEESCRNLERDWSIKFITIVATSYSVRQNLEMKIPVRDEFNKHALSAIPEQITQSYKEHAFTIKMSSVAAVSTAQAESYLSTVMLFILIQSGFVDHRQISRLPSVWKDFYTDLCKKRQLLIDDSDKEKLKSLRKAIQKIQENLRAGGKACAEAHNETPIITDIASRSAKGYARLSPEKARIQWQSKVLSQSYQNMLETRQQLPVYQYKDMILQAINENQLVIICADTGAGKSTQVPSFVLEHGLSNGQDCRILVTQPRRISAISLARRVSQELGERQKDLGTERSLVGYSIRLESKTSESTRITFATTGVLLRMIEASPQLSELDYLVLDEVHERTMDIDLLFIALKKLQQRRSNLKIILMSATVNAQKFSNYFDGAPTLNVPGRTFPVEIKYLEDAIEDTLNIETSHGRSISYGNEEDDWGDSEINETGLVGLESYSTRTRSKLAQMNEYRIDYEVIASLAEVIAVKSTYSRYSSAILIFMPGIAEIRRLNSTLVARDVFASKWIIHLLHSSFSTEDLERAFSIPPPGYRKIVIATNIAETGITIPDVTAVIDTCREKIMRFDERRQLSRLTEGFISRSSARQRRGRAARVREGLCFHLVTRHRFENLMLEQHVPEMLRLSLQDPILRIKIWNLGSIEETLAAAIDPPSGKNIRRAVDKLKDAGALSTTEELTHLGKIIARLPLEVVLSKLAVYGIVFKCLDAIITIIAALSSKSPFITEKGIQQHDPRLAFARGDSDLISTLNAYQGWRRAKSMEQSSQFCRKHHLSDQSLSAIEEQKTQLLVYLVDAGLLRLDHEERAMLNRSRISTNRKVFFSIPERYNSHDNDWMLNCVIAMAFYPKILVREGRKWRNVYSNQHVNLTSNSINRATDKPPRWLCFYEAMQARSGSLNVLETSKVPERVLAAVLGSAEIKFFSGVIVLDNGRMRFSLRQWRQMAAIKAIRESLAGVLDRCWRAPGLWMSQSDQQWMDLFASIVAGENTKTSRHLFGVLPH